MGKGKSCGAVWGDLEFSSENFNGRFSEKKLLKNWKNWSWTKPKSRGRILCFEKVSKNDLNFFSILIKGDGES